jgi:hypothetical protein
MRRRCQLIYSVPATTSVDAWVKAIGLLSSKPGRAVHNLILDIEEPFNMSVSDSKTIELVDRFLVAHGVDPTSTVAGTIFPLFHYLSRGAEGVFRYFPEKIYPKIHSGWGTYAGRILRRTDKEGNSINPLEIIVNKLRSQLKLPGPLSRAYEINVTDPFLDIPIYQPSTDTNLTLRQPCLSHLSFKLIDRDKLMLTAFYRSHFYLQRALGNLLGLSQLQAFVAAETGLKVGELVCHSSFACLESNSAWKVKEVRELIKVCQSLANMDIAEVRQ